MRFLFINPPRRMARGNIWSIVNSVTPPIGLAMLAAVLEKNGVEADIIDAQALNLSHDVLIENMKSMPRYDVVGITASTPEIGSATELSRMVRAHFPGTAVMMGGVHPSVFHRELVADGHADFVVRGEGEEAVTSFSSASDLHTVPSLTWKDDSGTVIVNHIPESGTDMDALPLPAYHKLPMHLYRSALGAAKRSPSLGIITSRGCPGSCTFCYSSMFGKQIRYVSAQKVIAHIRHLKENYGIREISFYDDTFTSDRERVMEICRLLRDEKPDMTWSCFARVDTVDQELLNAMKQAGCHQVMYGFESNDDAVLKAINKKVNTGRYNEVIRMTRNAGIDIRGAFMLGNAGETAKSLQNTIEYAQSLDIQFAIFNITTPYPGTPLYTWAQKKGYLLHTDWDSYDLAHPVMEMPELPGEAVADAYRRAFRSFYLRPGYVINRIVSMFTLEGISSGLRVFTGIMRRFTRGTGKGSP